ncbi:MAG: penicillin-binding transpeptidase domain-containing protein [Tissierellia bacterium]|nr:penicillin-binding transpeptidase domain-containing protein [Tissierellia bacterium]
MNSKDLKTKRRIVVLLTALILLFLALIVYLSYFMFFKAEDIKGHPANRRSAIVENTIKRGSIYDRNGELLTYSEGEPGNYQRHSNYPTLYSHLIGYTHQSLGNSGLEASFNDFLLNRNGNRSLKELSDSLNKKDEKLGNNLILTVDTKVQAKARELLQDRAEKGSVVLLNPKTGEIYAMVSLPDFNVMTISEDWESIQKNKDGALLNRALNGKYPPGSTFKIITSAALLEDGDIPLSYEDTGSQVINGREFNNAGNAAYGSIGIKEAFAQSSNAYYVSKGVDLGKNKLGAMADKFMFNQEIPFDHKVSRSIFDYKSSIDDTKLAASAIGQGDVLATPLNMAMVAGAIGNHGAMQKPILVRRVENPNKTTIWYNDPEVLSQAVPEEIAEEIKNLMIRVVNSGTGTNAQSNDFQLAGKTGTAENATGQSHAWFVGFAPAEDPYLAVAVILEQANESGNKAAAPIAKELMEYAYYQIEEDPIEEGEDQ